MTKFGEYLLFLILIFCVVVVLTNLSVVNAEIETGVIVNGSQYTDEPIEIKIDESGSKNYYSIDNTVGAKNKIVIKENKDRYVISHYLKEDGTTVKLIYPNGEQNNADSKIAIVNGTETNQPRIYGKDGLTRLTIVYDEYLHSEETVNFINPIGDRFTSVTNNLGKGGVWRNNGALFDNQISGLEFIVGENGNYTFKYWIDDFRSVAYGFDIIWENGARHVFNFTAVYDFVPNPEPVGNTTINNTDTNITIPVNNSNSTNITFNNTASTDSNNNTTLTDDEKSNNTVISVNKKTGISFYSLVGIVVLLLMATYFNKKR